MQTQTQELEVSIVELKEKIALAAALDSLHRSPAFKKLILKGYIVDKPVQLVKMVSLPQNEMQKELIQNSMIGISALQQYFASVYRDGEAANAALDEYEAELAGDRANG